MEWKDEYMVQIVQKLSIPQLFNRIRLNFEVKDRVIKVKGTQMQEEFGLTDIESLELEILLSRNYFMVYRYLLNIKEDKIGYEHKMKTLGTFLYKFVVDRLGFVPDLLRKDKMNVYKEALIKIRDEYISIDKSDYIMTTLLINTDFEQLNNVDNLMNIGMWMGLDMKLELSEEYLAMYDSGVVKQNIDSVGYFNYLVEMGYRDVEKVRKMLNHNSFKSNILIDDGKTSKVIEEYIWSYGKGEEWEEHVDDIYLRMSKYKIEKLGVKLDREKPTQIALTKGKDKVLMTFTDIISISIYNRGRTIVIYNNEYYDTKVDYMVEAIERVKNISYVLLQLLLALIKVITKKDLIKVR